MPKNFLRHSLSILLCSLLILLNVSFQLAPAAQRRAASGQASQNKRVRLVVGIVIDQFRYDYLTRFADQFSEGGFRRLLRDGAVFSNANYNFSPTYTACGHATFMSGSVPALNGIIGNEWYDREAGRRTTSVSDSKVKLLGGKEGAPAASPHRLIGSTVGDQLRFNSNGRSKVIGISFKDRSAILPAGKRPNGAYWFDSSTGAFVSSSYYFSDLPDWVKAFNSQNKPDKYFGAKWERLLSESAYSRSLPDDSPYERSSYGNKFPYTINGGEATPGPRFYSQFEVTPFANEYLADFARAAIEGEGLGQDEFTDLLTVSFSANDLLGHAYGPYSQEVQDMTLRTDRILAGLFDYIDKKIGLSNTIIALTADHGVAPIPEHSRALGFGGRVDSRALLNSIEAALSKRFGEDKWILAFVNSNIYFDYSALERRKADLSEVERIAGEAALKAPGVAACFARSQIISGQLPPTVIAQRVASGFYPQRNGDLILVAEPFFLVGDSSTASHGSPYSYDAHVPVIFYGAGIAAGNYTVECSPADIAPTLSFMLDIEPPSSSVGRILSEAIKGKNHRP